VKVIGPTKAQIELAVRNTGGLRIVSLAERHGSGYLLRLAPDGDRYRREQTEAVNWYGYRDFIRAVYQIVPGATVKTDLDSFHGREDFERRCHESAMRPRKYGEEWRLPIE
jgi:hypothetical protein